MNGSTMAAISKDGPESLKNFSLAQVLHGEQYMELKSPLPSSGKVSLLIDNICVKINSHRV